MSMVSVVIPCFNSARFLAEAIDSALGQTYADKEVIVVDDGSTDESPAIMAGYGDRIRVVRQPNSGLPAARNAGIREARGDLFAFLDADDWWAPDFLGKMVDGIVAGEAAIAYCGWQNVGLPGIFGEPFVPPDYEAMPDKWEKLIESARWPVHAALIRRETLVGAGLFNPGLGACEDFDLWLRTAVDHRIVLVPEVLAFYRFHGAQMTANRVRIALMHLAVQRAYLTNHPETVRRLGRKKVRKLTYGTLLRFAYKAYWERDLTSARALFRAVMRRGYGGLNDWKYMLPALLPYPLHKWLVDLADAGDGA